jgi:hypothetical protein
VGFSWKEKIVLMIAHLRVNWKLVRAVDSTKILGCILHQHNKSDCIDNNPENCWKGEIYGADSEGPYLKCEEYVGPNESTPTCDLPSPSPYYCGICNDIDPRGPIGTCCRPAGCSPFTRFDPVPHPSGGSVYRYDCPFFSYPPVEDPGPDGIGIGRNGFWDELWGEEYKQDRTAGPSCINAGLFECCGPPPDFPYCGYPYKDATEHPDYPGTSTTLIDGSLSIASQANPSSPWNGHTGPDGSGTIVDPHPQYYVWPAYHYNDNNWWRRLNRYGLLAHGYGEDDIIWPKDPDTGEWLLPRDNVVLGMPGYFYQNGQNESFIDSPYHCPYQSEILTDWIKDLSKEVSYNVEDQGELNGEYQFRVALSNRLNYTSWAGEINIPLARDPLTISSGGYGDFPGILAGTDSSHPVEYSICGQGPRYTDLSDDACVLDTVCSAAVSWYTNLEVEAVYSGLDQIPTYTVNLDNQWYYVNQRSSPIYNNVNFTPGIAGSHGPCGLHVPTLKFWRKGTPKIDADPIDYSSGESGYII